MTTTVDLRSEMAATKFYEGYSRFNDKENRYETWEEAVDRVFEMHKTKYSDYWDQLSPFVIPAVESYKNKEVLGAQRALQFGGEQLLRHQMRLYNCVSTYVDRPEVFGELFYVLLCGAGAGFSVQTHHIAKLPSVKARTKQAKQFVVPDSIEGWAQAVDVLLSSYFVGGGKHPEYEGRRVFFDLTNIRPKGALISGGFKAPGPDGLRSALDKIEYLIQGLIINTTEEVRLPSIAVYDIIMFMADAVLSGGVRRSATICLFSYDDMDMITAKTGNWFEKNPQRARANNSAIIVRNQITKEKFLDFFQHVKQFGEPGFIFTESTEHTFNPCVEIGKYPVKINKDGSKESGFQGCNLVEINGGKCVTEEDFYAACEAAAVIGTLQAGYTDFKFVSQTTKEIFEREALLGVSVTGWVNNPEILFDAKVLRKGAEIVKATNRKIASIIGINPAARTTCVKPSGNASVLLETASGIHAEHSKRYLRHVTIPKDAEVAQVIKQNNPYMVEDYVWSSSGTDYSIAFPVEPVKGSIVKSEMLGVKLLEKVKLVQENWVEYGTDESLCVDPTLRHNVSNTVTVDDWDEVADFVFENRHSFAGISFMSDNGDKAFNQAPFAEVITANEMVEKYGDAAIFASGMVVDALNAFDNLWDACDTAMGLRELPENANDSTVMFKRDWVRRFLNFASNYFGAGEGKQFVDAQTKAQECLKDCYYLHKWNKITNNYIPVDWSSLNNKKFIEIDTTGAQACAGGACEIDL